jgi:hypothetical protein
MRRMHAVMGREGLIDQDLLDNKHILLVSDGLSSGFSIDLALEYLKPVTYQSLIVATPFASTTAVDRMHVLADDIFCLSVIEDYFTTDHYYDVHDIPEHEVIVETIKRVMHDWKPATEEEKTKKIEEELAELQRAEEAKKPPVTEVQLDLSGGGMLHETGKGSAGKRDEVHDTNRDMNRDGIITGNEHGGVADAKHRDELEEVTTVETEVQVPLKQGMTPEEIRHRDEY